jgi:hypothetical protein
LTHGLLYLPIAPAAVPGVLWIVMANQLSHAHAWPGKQGRAECVISARPVTTTCVARVLVRREGGLYSHRRP